MKYHYLNLEFPALTDEAAAYLHKFINALMYAIDEQYYKQIHRYYSHQLQDMIVEGQPIQDESDSPPF